jgi:hypothetical protein
MNDKTPENVTVTNGILPNKDFDAALTRFFDVVERFRKNVEIGATHRAHLNTLEIQRAIGLIQKVLTLLPPK